MHTGESTSFLEAFKNIILITRSYNALILPGMDENWCRFMQRRTFAYHKGVQMKGCADVLICTSLVEAYQKIILSASSYTSLIIPGIDENWCRMMQRRTFAYRKEQNAFLESFNGKFRKECLDLNCLGKFT